MAYNAWVNIPIGSYLAGPVFRIWKAVTALLSGGMAGKISIVACSAGTAGASPPFSDAGWTSDTSPPNGSWLVLEWANGWADGSKMQVFVGYRSTTGALAGFGSLGAGLYVCCSPTGGWNVAGYFGASLADWRNGSIKQGNQVSPNTMALVLTSGIAGLRPGALIYAGRSGGGNHVAGLYAGALVPASGFPDYKYQCAVCSEGASSIYDWDWWGWLAGIYCLVPKVTLDGWQNAYAGWGRSGSGTSNGAVTMTSPAGGYIGPQVPMMNQVTGNCHGFLDEFVYYGAANGTVSGDGTRWFWNGMGWPREASRDGSWV